VANDRSGDSLFIGWAEICMGQTHRQCYTGKGRAAMLYWTHLSLNGGGWVVCLILAFARLEPREVRNQAALASRHQLRNSSTLPRFACPRNTRFTSRFCPGAVAISVELCLLFEDDRIAAFADLYPALRPPDEVEYDSESSAYWTVQGAVICYPPYESELRSFDRQSLTLAGIHHVPSFSYHIYSTLYHNTKPVLHESGDAYCLRAEDVDDVVCLIACVFSGGNTPCDTDGEGCRIPVGEVVWSLIASALELSHCFENVTVIEGGHSVSRCSGTMP